MPSSPLSTGRVSYRTHGYGRTRVQGALAHPSPSQFLLHSQFWDNSEL